ncbi:HAD family hydrolase [Nocardioides cynanchi]|uniref:HAD family hydrolase n=1 Tax=Nocardioides cynanchi TaxID=2558918 RepID=UPI001248A011|nr:HAD family phosphatase [Nocardioides cynanchi]
MGSAEVAAGGVVFDLDGTLVDSEPFWMRGFSIGLSQSLLRHGYGDHDLQPSQMSRFLGGRVPDTVRVIVESLDLPEPVGDDHLAAMVQETVDFVTREFVAGPIVIQEAVDTARGLHERGVPMGVASSSALTFIDAAIEALGLADAFPVRVSAFDLPVGKPDPTVYLTTLGEMGLPAARALAVEDSPVGVASAVNAHLGCLWFRRPPEAGHDVPPQDWQDQLLEAGVVVDLADSLVEVSPHLTVELVLDSLDKVLARSAAG